VLPAEGEAHSSQAGQCDFTILLLIGRSQVRVYRMYCAAFRRRSTLPEGAQKGMTGKKSKYGSHARVELPRDSAI